MTRRLERGDAWLFVGVLGLVVVLNVSTLGDAAWPFRPGHVHATGLFAPLVRAAHERWDLGLLRSAAMLGGVVATALAVVVLSLGRLRLSVAVAAAVVVACLLVLPAVALQAGLRQSSAPWFFTNDSTYQIELAGKLVRGGSSPYGYDYTKTGLARWYSLDGSAQQPSKARQVALHHFAYFPGSALAAAVWGVLPKPLSDYRFFVALCALALLPAALLFPAPPGMRLALGLALAVNPLTVQASWFGTADAPSLLLVVLAFALIARRRCVEAAALLGAAVVFKQFALVALPFAALQIALVRDSPRRFVAPAAAFLAVVLAGMLPFFVAHPHAYWSDTISYGTSTYRIIGYGLAALLLRAHVLSSRTGSYPFLPIAIVTWLPLTIWLAIVQHRSRMLWVGAAGFTVSVFTLLFIARVFQTSYLVWPLVGGLVALALSGAASPRRPLAPSGRSPSP
ncbi:MAG TPA: glycosyltransferase 87 family protein [Gaiellaceae bacterium]|nr:glycosyltransferase 87 family protein [Gaiellaceae bacterium]